MQILNTSNSYSVSQKNASSSASPSTPTTKVGVIGDGRFLRRSYSAVVLDPLIQQQQNLLSQQQQTYKLSSSILPPTTTKNNNNISTMENSLSTESNNNKEKSYKQRSDVNFSSTNNIMESSLNQFVSYVKNLFCRDI